MLKYTQTIRWLLPTNCLSVLEHFVGSALKGLKIITKLFEISTKVLGIYFVFYLCQLVLVLELVKPFGLL